MGDPGAIQGTGESAPHRGFQFQRGTNEAGAEDRADYEFAATLLDAAARDRNRNSAVCPSQPHWGDQLFAHGFGPVDRKDDSRTSRRTSARRLAPTERGIQGTAPQS